MALYFDGRAVDEASFDVAKPVPLNEYHNPVVLGVDYVGLLDEVKLLTYGKTAEEVADFGYCPPTADLSKVAAYFPLNVGPGPAESFQGIGAACYPIDSPEPCLTGTLVNLNAEPPQVEGLIRGQSVDDTPHLDIIYRQV